MNIVSNLLGADPKTDFVQIKISGHIININKQASAGLPNLSWVLKVNGSIPTNITLIDAIESILVGVDSKCYVLHQEGDTPYRMRLHKAVHKTCLSQIDCVENVVICPECEISISNIKGEITYG